MYAGCSRLLSATGLSGETRLCSAVNCCLEMALIAGASFFIRLFISCILEWNVIRALLDSTGFPADSPPLSSALQFSKNYFDFGGDVDWDAA